MTWILQEPRPLRVCMCVKLGHGNVGFVASRLTIPTTSLMAREVPKHHTCKSLRIKGDDRPEAMVRPSMPTSCGQQRDFGQRCKSARGGVISSHGTGPLKKRGVTHQAIAPGRAKLPWQKARHGPASPIPLFLFMKLAGPIFWHPRCIYI